MTKDVQIIAEMGFNHLGDPDIADEYLNELLKSGVNGITFQIREPLHKKQKPHRYLSDENLILLATKIKKHNKKLGVAIADINYIPFFEQLEADFYKVIRNDITNTSLIEKLLELNKKVYVSTGMASEDEIVNFINSIMHKCRNFTLVHTQLSYPMADCNLKCMNYMKTHGLDVAYGHHCEDPLPIFMSLCYDPSDIFLYIKGEKNIVYPDNNHAIRIGEIIPLIDQIKKAEKAIGTGVKQKMINKIKEIK